MNVDFVKELFPWLRRRFWCFNLSTAPDSLVRQTARRVSEDQGFRAHMERLVHDADLGISRVGNHEGAGWAAETSPLFRLPNLAPYEVQTLHETPDSAEPVEFSLEEDESLGTQRFFGIAGRVLTALDNGDVLVVDELDSSMHPRSSLQRHDHRLRAGPDLGQQRRLRRSPA